MAGALRIDKAAHAIMNFRPEKPVEKDGYRAFYHEDRLYSVRGVKNGVVHLVYAGNPYQAIDMVKNEWRPVLEEINTMEELSVNISFCPYCGSENIGREDNVNCYCDECGRDFKIMTHE